MLNPVVSSLSAPTAALLSARISFPSTRKSVVLERILARYAASPSRNQVPAHTNLDSEKHSENCLGFDAKLLEESQHKRSIFDSSASGRSELLDSSIEENSKSKFERYLKRKQEVAPNIRAPKEKRGASKDETKQEFRRAVQNLERSIEEIDNHPSASQEARDIETAILQSLM